MLSTRMGLVMIESWNHRTRLARVTSTFANDSEKIPPSPLMSTT
jgi:hypothetical protein